MDTLCAGPACTNSVTQPKSGGRRRFCSAACKQAAYRDRRNAIVWEPLDDAVVEHVPEPTPSGDPDTAVAGAVLEARILAGTFRNLGRRARPQFAWRCTKTGEAIHGALDDYFKGVDR